MIEDKLTHDERVRLECIAQASNVTIHRQRPASAEQIIEIASRFETYVREGLTQ